MHDRGRRLERDRRLLAVAVALIASLMVGEIIAGLLAGSLALLADAGHMASDALAVAFALLAASLATQPARGRWTYGFHRLEILAAQANGLMLWFVGIWVLIEASLRLISPPEVEGSLVLAVAIVGLVVTLVTTKLLSRAERENLNVRAVFLHVATDLAAFAGTALAGGLVLATGWDRFDPIASLLVVTIMFWAGFSILRDTTRIFMEASPIGIEPSAVNRVIANEPEVVEVHDLHIWTITTGFPALSAHVLVEPRADCHHIRRKLERTLAEQFGLEHTTLQVDHSLSRDLGRRLPLEERGR